MSTTPENGRPTGVVSDLLLERFALGELPAERLAAVQALVDADPSLQDRLRDLQNDDRAIRIQHPPRVMAAAIRKRAGVAAPKKRSPWVFAAPVLAMAAVALLFIQGIPEEPNDFRKGENGTHQVDHVPRLQVLREGDGPLHDGDLAHAGDTLGFRYDADGYGYGALFSIDGAGVVTLHMPESANGALELRQGVVTLDLGYVLDDAPDFERFFLVLSEDAFDLHRVLDAARDLAGEDDAADADLMVAEHLEVIDFMVGKGFPTDGGTP